MDGKLMFGLELRLLINVREDNLFKDQGRCIYTAEYSTQYLKGPSVKLSELELTLLSNPSVRVNRRLVPKYISEYSRDVLIGRYEKEISALLSGFESVLPVKVYNYFTFDEFKTILTGKPADYTAEEFMDAIECSNLKIKTALRQFVTEATSVQRGLLLKFMTGLNALPADGFEGLNGKLSAEVHQNLVGKLPTSSTCSFLLKVPPFTDYEKFSSNLQKAIEWAAATDNETGLGNGEGIVLGLDSESDEDENETKLIEIDSESDVSDISDNEETSISYSDDSSNSFFRGYQNDP